MRFEFDVHKSPSLCLLVSRATNAGRSMGKITRLSSQSDDMRHNGEEVGVSYKSGDVVALAASDAADALAGEELSTATTV